MDSSSYYPDKFKKVDETVLSVIEERDALRAELARVKALYAEWGFKDAPCPKHSKKPLLTDYCASCDADKLRAEVERLKQNNLDWIERCRNYRKNDRDEYEKDYASLHTENVSLRADIAAAVEVLRELYQYSEDDAPESKSISPRQRARHFASAFLARLEAK